MLAVVVLESKAVVTVVLAPAVAVEIIVSLEESGVEEFPKLYREVVTSR
jgi:hypothetical protein